MKKWITICILPVLSALMGAPGERFAIRNAGGGFAFVGAMHGSFPHALELRKMGYNAFALIYRPGAQTACTVVMQYTGPSEYTEHDPPTFVNVGTNDGIANWKTMERRLQTIDTLGIPTEFHAYEGLRHGFGLGTGTVAEGWINDAVAFWEAQFVTPGVETYRGFLLGNVLRAGLTAA